MALIGFSLMKLDVPVTPVKLASVDAGPVRAMIRSNSTLEALRCCRCRAGGGRIAKVLTDVGARVAKGKVLMRLEPVEPMALLAGVRLKITCVGIEIDQFERSRGDLTHSSPCFYLLMRLCRRSVHITE
jgi:hypothetical protein